MRSGSRSRAHPIMKMLNLRSELIFWYLLQSALGISLCWMPSRVRFGCLVMGCLLPRLLVLGAGIMLLGLGSYSI